MHHMLDVAQLGDGLVGQPEIGLGQVADQRFCSFTPLLGEAFEPAQRRTTNHHPHLGVRPFAQQT
jgi:hypothetical protein